MNPLLLSFVVGLTLARDRQVGVIVLPFAETKNPLLLHRLEVSLDTHAHFVVALSNGVSLEDDLAAVLHAEQPLVFVAQVRFNRLSRAGKQFV